MWSNIGKLAIDDVPELTVNDVVWKWDIGMATQPAITRVCRVLRAELLQHYYRTKVCMNTKVTPLQHLGQLGAPVHRSPDAILIGNWLRRIGVENRREVRGLSIVQDPDSPLVREEVEADWEVDLQIGPGRSIGELHGWQLYEFEVKFL